MGSLPLQAAMLMPPLALKRISHTVTQRPQLTLESKAKLLAACMLILEVAQVVFFSERYLCLQECRRVRSEHIVVTLDSSLWIRVKFRMSLL